MERTRAARRDDGRAHELALLSMWGDGETMEAIGSALGRTRSAVSGYLGRHGLFGEDGRTAARRAAAEGVVPGRVRTRVMRRELPHHPARTGNSRRNTSSQRRFATPSGHGGRFPLQPHHPAAVEGRTTWPKSLVASADSPRLLVSGVNSRKIGRRVAKGRWRGMPIYTLTLEERATCPRTCAAWLTCYGRNMPFARRIRADADLGPLLMAEISAMQERHPWGFVVRLHVLGDFPDREYAELWAGALELMPALRIFGYTAHARGSDVGRVVGAMNRDHPGRCSMRFSGLDEPKWGAVVVDAPSDTAHVVCPAQTGGTDCCATCALCWQSDRTIAFLEH